MSAAVTTLKASLAEEQVALKKMKDDSERSRTIRAGEAAAREMRDQEHVVNDLTRAIATLENAERGEKVLER